MAHRTMRKRLAPVVATGTVPCARCGELIDPDDAWDVDHKDDGRGWFGPSHRRCNRHHGWTRMVDVVGGNGRRDNLEDAPCLWSQRWFDDPPLGTQVLLGRGMAEVYLGGGQWSRPVPFVRDVA